MSISKIEPSQNISIIVAIILVLFASLVAPKLPKSITVYLENIWVRFFIFTCIAYLATHNVVTAIIAVIAVLISYQTLSVHKITDTIMDKTNKLLNNINNQSSVPINEVPQPHNNLESQSHNNLESQPHNNLESQPPNNLESQPPNNLESQPYNNEQIFNDIFLFTKKVLLANPTITGDVIKNTFIKDNKNIDNTLINDAVNHAYASNNKPTNNMQINNNNIDFVVNKSYPHKNTMKYLQSTNNNNIPQEYTEDAMVLMKEINDNSSLLNDTCNTNQYKEIYNCNTIGKTIDSNFNGINEDFENYGHF